MKRKNFGKIGVIIAFFTTGLHYFEIIDVYVNGIIGAIAFVLLSISFFESILSKRLRDNKLIDIKSSNPILGFPDRKTFQFFDKINKTEFNKWGKLKTLTIWLPDKNFANIWVESL